MQKKKYLTLSLTVVLLFLVGCQKPPSAKDSAEAFIKAVVYNDETVQLQDYFAIEDQGSQEEANRRFSTSAKSKLGLDASYDEKIAKIADQMAENTNKLTSFSTKVSQEKQGKASVELTITGLAAITEAELATIIGVELAQAEVELTAETTEEERMNLVNHTSFKVFEGLVNERQAAEKATTVTMELMSDSAAKDRWVIQNQDRFISELLVAFGH